MGQLPLFERLLLQDYRQEDLLVEHDSNFIRPEIRCSTLWARVTVNIARHFGRHPAVDRRRGYRQFQRITNSPKSAESLAPTTGKR